MSADKKRDQLGADVPRPFGAFRCDRRGFTLLEVLLVITTVVVLAALLLPAVNKAHLRGKRVKCLNNLKQIGVAFQTFAHDHNDKYPMQVSTNAGGTMEFVTAAERLGGSFFFAFRHFQAVSNELADPRLLICPADNRLPAPTFAALQNQNVSYFLAPLAQSGHSDSIVAGDRNITGTWSSGGSVLQINADNLPNWTHELHDGQGHLLFGDARVELLNSKGLLATLSSAKQSVSLYVPALTPNSLSGGSIAGSFSGRGGAKTAGSSSSGSSGPATIGSASSGNSGGGALSQLEQVFAVAGDKPKPATPNSGTVMAKPPESPPVANSQLPPIQTSIASAKMTNRPAASNAVAVTLPDSPQTAGDPWPVSFGQLVMKFGSRGTWLLLLLLLAVLVSVEVLRRRKARKNAEK